MTTSPPSPAENLVLAHRPSFSLRHRALRAVWMTLWLLLACWTPPPARHWRRFLLRCFGAQMGRNSDVRGGARVWYPP